MSISEFRRLIGALATVGCVIATLPAAMMAQRSPRSATMGSLPTSLSDAEFWKLIHDLSEPGGEYRMSDNFVSDETGVAWLVDALTTRVRPGSVYIGVGPEQNFTYIAAVRPSLAFVVDIRGQNMIEHLMFKAIFELAKDRADFISILFSKPRPTGINTAYTLNAIWNGFWHVPTNRPLHDKNLERITALLVRKHRFQLDSTELSQLRYVFDAFRSMGPNISEPGYTLSGPARPDNPITFANISVATDASGTLRGFLATEENFRFVKQLHSRNLIIPVTGDFAGPKAIRAIAGYVRSRGSIVGAFYASNVEGYLTPELWKRFYSSVATLPIDSTSTLVRTFLSFYVIAGVPEPGMPSGLHNAESICPLATFMRAFAEGRPQIEFRRCDRLRAPQS